MNSFKINLQDKKKDGSFHSEQRSFKVSNFWCIGAASKVESVGQN